MGEIKNEASVRLPERVFFAQSGNIIQFGQTRQQRRREEQLARKDQRSASKLHKNAPKLLNRESRRNMLKKFGYSYPEIYAAFTVDEKKATERQKKIILDVTSFSIEQLIGRDAMRHMPGRVEAVRQ